MTERPNNARTGTPFRLRQEEGTGAGISPLRHVPTIKTDSGWSGLAWLFGAVVLFLLVGFVGFRRRDIL